MTDLFAAQPVPERRKFLPPQTGFMRTLHAHVAVAMLHHGRAARREVWAKGAAFGAAGLSFYAALFFVQPGPLMLGLAVLAALTLTFVVINLGHDAVHNTLGMPEWVRQIVVVATFGIVGMSGTLWGLRHVKNHHAWANLDGADTDVDATVLLRMTPHQPWLPVHRYQMIYAPVLYGLALPLRVFVMDWFSLAAMEGRTVRDVAAFLATKAIHISLAVAPLLATPVTFWPWLGGYLLAYAASSTLLTMILIGTHIHEDAAFPEGDPLDTDFPTHVMRTTCDWAPDKPWANFLFGGLNAHTAHHLLPRLPHPIYQRIAGDLPVAARKHGLPYLRMSMWEMIAGHYRHLIRMSRKPEAKSPGRFRPLAR